MSNTAQVKATAPSWDSKSKLSSLASASMMHRSEQVELLPEHQWRGFTSAQEKANAKLSEFIDELTARDVRETLQSLEDEIQRLEAQKLLAIATKKSIKKILLSLNSPEGEL